MTATIFDMMAEGLASLQKLSMQSYHYNARKKVYQRDKLILYHYEPLVKKPHSTPLLVVFATVNRPEILDLFPDTSFIHGLLAGGMDVYLLDWGYPDKEDSDTSLSDYVNDYLHQTIKFIIDSTRQEKINLLGICQGGLMCLCYSALYQHIKKLVLISTPVDFSTADNTVAQLLNKVDVDELIAISGNVPGPWLTQFFISLRPFELVGKKYLNFIDQIENEVRKERFLQVEKWLHDAPDQAGKAFKELAEQLYRDNKLIQGKLFLEGRKVDLARITIPVLNVMASEDEIVPVSASRSLNRYIKSPDYAHRLYPSGHIGIYVSDKVGKRMPKSIASWLKK